MVDFNNESTVAQAPGDVVQMTILERREYVIEALQLYHKQKFQGVSPSIAVVKASVLALYYQLEPMLVRNGVFSEGFDFVKEVTDKKDLPKITELFGKINTWLDEIELVRVDTRQKIDRTIAEEVNTGEGI